MTSDWSGEEVHMAFGDIDPKPPASGKLQFNDQVRFVVVNEKELGNTMKGTV